MKLAEGPVFWALYLLHFSLQRHDALKVPFLHSQYPILAVDINATTQTHGAVLVTAGG